MRRHLNQEHRLEIEKLQNRFRTEVDAAGREEREAAARTMERQQLKFEDLKQNLIQEKHSQLSTLKAQHASEIERAEETKRMVCISGNNFFAGSGACSFSFFL